MFTLKIQTDNAAFEDRAGEVARILGHVQQAVQTGNESGKVFDLNGNSVGSFRLTD